MKTEHTDRASQTKAWSSPSQSIEDRNFFFLLPHFPSLLMGLSNKTKQLLFVLVLCRIVFFCVSLFILLLVCFLSPLWPCQIIHNECFSWDHFKNSALCEDLSHHFQAAFQSINWPALISFYDVMKNLICTLKLLLFCGLCSLRAQINKRDVVLPLVCLSSFTPPSSLISGVPFTNTSRFSPESTDTLCKSRVWISHSSEDIHHWLSHLLIQHLLRPGTILGILF